MFNRRCFLGCQGFTLIEFMIASAILTAGLLGMAMLLATGIQSNALGANTGQALSLAQDKIEQLRNLPAANAARALGGSLTTNLVNYYDTSGIFTRRWSLAAGPAGTQICTVRVFATTEDYRTRKKVELTTLIQ